MARKLFHMAFAMALAAAPLTGAACQQIPRAEVAWAKESTTMKFELFRGNRIIADGRINGHKVDFLLDTGAGVTTVDRAFARQIGLPKGQSIPAQGSGGTVEAELVTGVTLELGGLTLKNAPVVVIDLASVARGLGRPMTVVLGRELFDNAVVGVDWQQTTLSIARQDSFAPPPNATMIELGKGDDRLNTIPVAVAGAAPVKAHFDVGNGSTLSLPKSYWEKRPELASLPYAMSEAGGVGGMHPVRLVTVDRIAFGGQTFRNVPVTLSETKPSGAVDEVNAGIGLLKPFRVTMDLGRNRLYLEPLAKPPVFVRDRAGLRSEFDGEQLTLAFVSPGPPAARAGLRKGDRLVAVDGQRVGKDYFQSAASGWNQRAAGETVRLELGDGRKVVVTLADYY
ncbi:retropepsin-like aspartic protease family protein [Sphingomonas mesophila]|uniref:retropepsin-like aspartic protease family protein n=1 Tax=Sphingomonas mesophila TaxID=2303576 RepID=UPI0013C36826|nr:aspartyl protease family protein [Sphingomonas mesophila]